MKFKHPDDLITSVTMLAAEQAAVEAGIPLAQLMENAGRAVAEGVMKHYGPRPTLVFCGPGNNGGDGFVAARYLRESGWTVRVMSTAKSLNDYKSPALEAAQNYPGEIETLSPNGLEDIELVIDGLFGTGLNTPVSGDLKSVIDIINDLDAPVVAIDIPSGIYGDTGQLMGTAMQADLTVTFGRGRPGHFLVPGCLHSGKVIVADTGIPQKLFHGDRVTTNLPRNWMHHLRKPTAFDNKFTRGSCLIMGSIQLSGAVKLSARAARRVGVGMTVIACPSEAYSLYATTALGEIIAPVGSLNQLQEVIEKRKVSCAILGPGAPVTDQTESLVIQMLHSKMPMVLDGGALSCFEGHPDELLSALHDQVVLTPHEGEFARLFPDLDQAHGNKLGRVRDAAQRAGCTIVLKGYDSVIASPEGDCVINGNASATLSTAGAGDVLAGLIAGLRANHHPPFVSAQVGVWMHGEAAQSKGEGLIAEDIVEEIPRVWKLLRSKSQVAF